MRRCVGRAASERDSRSWMQIAVVVRSSSKPQRKTNVFSSRYVRANLECVNFNLKPKNTSRNTATHTARHCAAACTRQAHHHLWVVTLEHAGLRSIQIIASRAANASMFSRCE